MVEEDGDLDEIELTDDQNRIELLETQLKDAAKQAAVQAQEYVDVLQAQKDKLSLFTKGQNKVIAKAVEAAEADWSEGISLRVQGLPLSWSPAMVAKKIIDPKFVHPQGIADFIPTTDNHGNIRRWDGAMVPPV